MRRIIKWKKILGMGMVLGMLIFADVLPTFASTGIINQISELETTQNSAEDTQYSLLRGNNLSFGSMKITKVSSNEVHIYGLTQCYHECDNVYLEIYLERKVNGSYSTYKYWDFEDQNVTNLDASIDVIVPSGYYYRVRGYHAAKDGSKESTTTLTSGILVK